MRHLSRIITLFVLFAFSSILMSTHAQPPDTQPLPDGSATGVRPTTGYAPDRLLVKFRADTMPTARADGSWRTGQVSLDRLLAGDKVQGATRLFAFGPARSTAEMGGLERIYVLWLAPGSDVAQAVRAFAADPAVEWAEPDYLAYPAATPTDPLFAQQWGLAKIGAPAAWDVTTGSAAVPIAIVDSGIDLSHPDLAGKLWVNPGEIAGNGLDDDNNGFVDDVNGWDLVNSDNDPGDDYGHGTQVAGVAAAATNNGTGVAGVCWGCRLMAVKVMQAGGVANYSDVAAGVVYAAQKGAPVINLSLGGYSDSSALRAAIQAATETYGAVVVAGAGNDNLSTPFYPAAYDGVLAVAGTGPDDTKADLSNFGTWVDISAPALAITTTFMGGDWGAVDGTSFAAPFAAGLAGLLRSQNSGWSADMVRAQILHLADDIDGLNPGFEGQLGSGRVNANRALSTPAQPQLSYVGHAVDGTVNGRPEPGSTVDLAVVLYDDWADARGVYGVLSSSDPYVTVDVNSASFTDILAFGQGTNVTPFRFDVSAAAPYGHVINLGLHVTAAGGYAIDLSVSVQTASSVVYPPATLTSQTWTNDRVYVINKETGIQAGQTLTIEPGTHIRFAGNYSLSVAGTLVADGLAEQPILFTSNNAVPARGDWGQIRFLDSSVDAAMDSAGNYAAGSILRHTRIEYGRGIGLDNAAPFVAHNVLAFDLGAAIDGSASPGLVIAYNEIDENSEGMQIAGPDGEFLIVGNTVTGGATGLRISGPGTIAGNSVSDALYQGIEAQNVLTVTANRVMNCGEGISADGGSIIGNLLAGNDTNGLRLTGGTAVVISNTVISNGQAGILIEGGAPDIRHNNLIANSEGYALRNAIAAPVGAMNNWWAHGSESAVQEVIYDGLDEFGLGLVDYGNYLAGPEQTAPAYLTDFDILPDTTLGIQTAIFDASFSRPMDWATDPSLLFHTARRGTWTSYHTGNSPLTDNEVTCIAFDAAGVAWMGTNRGGLYRYDGTNWTIWNKTNSPLVTNSLRAIVFDDDGSQWFGLEQGGVAHLDGSTWVTYTPSNSALPNIMVYDVHIDRNQAKWFATGGGAARLLNGGWTVYQAANSGLPHDSVLSMAEAPTGDLWFGTAGGAARFDGTTWTVYTHTDWGLESDMVYAVAIDQSGATWLGTQNGLVRFDGTTWQVYRHEDSEVLNSFVRAIDVAPDGTLWFATYYGAARFDGQEWTTYLSDFVLAIAHQGQDGVWFGTHDHGASVLWQGPDFIVADNGEWLDERTYRATHDISALIPRDDYLLRVVGAAGTDGIAMAPAVGYTFTVDYAGAIGDTTPPPVPVVLACADAGASTLSASWSARDPESAITLYRYAVGTTPASTDVINWTNTADPSFVRSSLSLIAGQTYHVSIKARNEAGLWSEAGRPGGVVAGSGTCTTNKRNTYLPLVVRRR